MTDVKPSNGYDEARKVTNDDALGFLQKMIQCGYFHDRQPLSEENASRQMHEDSTIEDMRNYTSSSRTHYTIDGSNLIFTKDNSRCMTREFLENEIHQLVRSRGRISLNAIVSELDVNFDMQIIANELSQDQGIYLIGMDLFTDEYLDDKLQQLHKDLQICKQKIISEVANEWKLPLQFTFEAVLTRMNKFPDMECIKDNNGVKKLMTKEYETQLLQEVQTLLKSASEPVKLTEIGARCQLDAMEVSNPIKQWCEEGVLEGTLHMGQDILGAHYTPQVHEKRQQEAVLERFDTSGFVTLQHASNVGISHKRMQEFILQHNRKAIVLEECIFHPYVILLPMQAALDECIQSKSFVDLSLHLPDGVTEHDTRTLIENYVFTSMDDEEVTSGCLLLTDGEALYFSVEMMNHVRTHLLPSLIESYARQRAQEITDAQEESATLVADAEMKLGRKGRNSKGKAKGDKKRSRTVNETESMEYGIVPLTLISEAISEQYPDLADIQESYHTEDGVIVEPDWDSEGYNGPLYEFCRLGLRNSKFEKDCQDAIKAELKILLATRKGNSLRSRKQGAAKFNSIETSFEDSFRTACILVQVLAKLPRYMMSNNTEVSEEMTSKLTRDFLCGCGADFSRRITEYCLFKHGVEEGLFHFEEDSNEVESTKTLNHFYSEVDTARTVFPKTYLSCTSDNHGKWRDPLKMLRDELPGTVGVSLARLWVLTGGENYSGGGRESEDGTVTYRPGKFDQFLTYLEESCLSMCGIPFKILDKKSEKQLLFARRKQLQNSLQESTGTEDVYNLSVVLLLQQLKNLVLCGDDSVCRSICEHFLMKDRKIPPDVSNLFIKTSQLMKDKTAIPNDQIRLLKLCGLSRDISNHSVE